MTIDGKTYESVLVKKIIIIVTIEKGKNMPLLGERGELMELIHHDKVETIVLVDTNKTHTNRGSAGMIRLYLHENAPVGIHYRFSVVENFQLNIDPQSKTLFAGNDAIPNRYYSASDIGASLEICSDENGDWVVISKSGTWTRET